MVSDRSANMRRSYSCKKAKQHELKQDGHELLKARLCCFDTNPQNLLILVNSFCTLPFTIDTVKQTIHPLKPQLIHRTAV